MNESKKKKLIDSVKQELADSIRIKESLIADEDILGQLVELSAKCSKSLSSGNKIIFAGNGGSFADAQHLSAELISKLSRKRGPLASVVLGANSSALTAIANDYGYNHLEPHAEVVPYHWDNRSKLHADHDYIQRLASDILQQLTPILNDLHHLTFSSREWNIIIGYWLRVFITVICDRYSSLQSALAVYPRLRIIANSTDLNLLHSSDTLQFINLSSNSDSWNECLFAFIATHFQEFTVEDLNRHSLPQAAASLQPSQPRASLVAKTKRILSHLSVRNSIFFSNSYIPPLRQLVVHLLLRQFPFSTPIPPSHYPFTRNLRRYREWSLASPAISSKRESIIRNLLPLLMPQSFLESFKDHLDSINSLPLPLAPKAIFTSNSHYYNEHFKIWSALKVLHGSKLVIGEHGGFGTGLFNGTHSYELSISNLYLSTGWSHPRSSRYIPVPQFRFPVLARHARKTGPALLVLGSMQRYAFDARAMMISSQVSDYLRDQLEFLSCIPTHLRDSFLVREFPQDYGWSARENLKRSFPSLKFSANDQTLWDTASTCRLFVATYNATTYQESLFYNFPTILYWNPKHWELSVQAAEIFNVLKLAHIYHPTPQSAARHISQIWHRIDDWWYSSKTQDAVRLFCSIYSPHSISPAYAITDALAKL